MDEAKEHQLHGGKLVRVMLQRPHIRVIRVIMVRVVKIVRITLTRLSVKVIMNVRVIIIVRLL